MAENTAWGFYLNEALVGPCPTLLLVFTPFLGWMPGFQGVIVGCGALLHPLVGLLLAHHARRPLHLYGTPGLLPCLPAQAWLLPLWAPVQGSFDLNNARAFLRCQRRKEVLKLHGWEKTKRSSLSLTLMRQVGLGENPGARCTR